MQTEQTTLIREYGLPIVDYRRIGDSAQSTYQQVWIEEEGLLVVPKEEVFILARSSLAVSNQAVLIPPLIVSAKPPLVVAAATHMVAKSAMRDHTREPQRVSTEWTDEAIARLERTLYAAFDSEVLEDGMAHPADDVLENALSLGDDQPLLAWLSEVSLDAGRPSFAASLLRCLGRRTDPGTAVWRADLVCKALVVKNVQIRDAAVQAAEHWADSDLISVLEGHDESEQWLAQYIDMVVNDLKTS